MRHEQYGMRPLLPQPDDQFADATRGRRVQRNQRLVHQQQVGVDGEGAHQGGAAAHAHRQPLRIAVLGFRQADHLEQVIDIGRIGVGRQGQFDVFPHRAPGQQARVLEYITQSWRLAGRQSVTDFAVEMAVQPGNQIQQRGLAAAGRADQTDELPGGQFQAQVLNDGSGGRLRAGILLAVNVDDQRVHRCHLSARRSSGRRISHSINCTTPMKAME